MELPDDSYFAQARRWRLTVHDHVGDAYHFSYRVHGDAIDLDDNDGEPEWTTAIPIAKLHAALELGESLTSMYMRINDNRFAPAVDTALADADIIDDPLIRCLFNDAFGAYQAAQLRRIRQRVES